MRIIARLGLGAMLGLIAWPVSVQARLDALREAGMGRLIEAKSDCLLSGEAALNLRQVRYSLYSLDNDLGDLGDRARSLGWREIDSPIPSLVGPEGSWNIRFYESGSRRLILVSNPENPGWLAAVFFESADLFFETHGDAPGRDPGGWPKPAICKRILHAAGGGIEAAWYKTSGSPATIMARVRASLSANGWDVIRLGKTALAASRGKSGDIAFFAEKDDKGAYLLVTSIMEKR